MASRIDTRLLGLLLTAACGFGLPAAGVAQAQAETRVHTVQPGETVRDIAAAYGLTSVSVLAANTLPNADVVQVGQSLVIPPSPIAPSASPSTPCLRRSRRTCGRINTISSPIK